MIKTVLFDLDDTIFDHKHARLCALSSLKNNNLVISKISLDELEQEHENLLRGNYTKVLDKTLTLNDSMVERTFFLFKKYGVDLTIDEAIKYTELYKQAYDSNRRAIPGVKELIEKLRNHCRIGIVSNGLYEIQIEKVRVCEIEELIDFMILSEEVEAIKPDKIIFEEALKKADSRPEEVIFIGDSWTSDVLGALNCGIRTIWINRYNQQCPDSNLTYEINSFSNLYDYIMNKCTCNN